MAMNRQNLEAFFQQRRELHRQRMMGNQEQEEVLLYGQEAPLPPIPAHMLGDEQQSLSYDEPPLPTAQTAGQFGAAPSSQKQPAETLSRMKRISRWFQTIKELPGKQKLYRPREPGTPKSENVQTLRYRPLHKEIADSLPVYQPPEPAEPTPSEPSEHGGSQPEEIEPEVEIPHWSQRFRDFESVGDEFEVGWGHSSIANYYRDLIRSHGYNFDYSRPIFKGDDNKFDHSVWFTTRVEHRVEIRSVLKRIGDRIVRVNEKHDLNDQVEYAIKVVSLAYYKWKYRDYNIALRALRKEADILRRLDHPHIIRVTDYIPMADRQTGFPFTYIAMVMEYMNGDLLHLITARENRYPCMDAEECFPWFLQISLAVAYLHYDIRGPDIPSIVVTHMAIHPKNILYKVIDWSTGELCFKLTDFEECCIFDRSHIPLRLQDLFDTFKVQSYASRPYRHYMSAPELHRPDWQNLRARPNDVYSLAMCFCYCIVASLKASEAMSAEMRQNISRYKETQGWQHLIGLMTNPDPDRRPTMFQVLDHPWITQTEYDPTVYNFLKPDFNQGNDEDDF